MHLCLVLKMTGFRFTGYMNNLLNNISAIIYIKDNIIYFTFHAAIKHNCF